MEHFTSGWLSPSRIRFILTFYVQDLINWMRRHSMISQRALMNGHGDPPCSRGDPSTKWRTSLKGRAHKCPDFSACLFHFLSQTTGHQMRLTYWKIMFYGRVVKNRMEALALLSNSNLLVLPDPKGFDFPPSWKLLVSSKGVPLTGQTYLMWGPLGGGWWTSLDDPLTSCHSDSR